MSDQAPAAGEFVFEELRDHDERIRALEVGQARALGLVAGAAAVFAAIGSVLGTWATVRALLP